MTPPEPKLQQEIDELKQRFEDAPRRAREERDAGLRGLATRYELRQVDIVKLTGYSRETVRQALNPEALSAVHNARKNRAEAEREDGVRAVVAQEALNGMVGRTWDDDLKERVAEQIAALLWGVDRVDIVEIAGNENYRAPLVAQILNTVRGIEPEAGPAAIDRAVQNAAKAILKHRGDPHWIPPHNR